MTRFEDIVAMFDNLAADDLRQWISEGWVRPEGGADAPRFRDVDIARVRLIVACRYDLDIDTGAMPVVLSLLDQVHGMRRELAALADAVAGQPDDVRDAILEAARRRRETR